MTNFSASVSSAKLLCQAWDRNAVEKAFLSDSMHLERGGSERNLLQTCFLCSIYELQGYCADYLSVDSDGDVYIALDDFFRLGTQSGLAYIAKRANEIWHRLNWPGQDGKGINLENFKRAFGYDVPVIL